MSEIRARSLDGGDITIAQADIAAFRAELQGPLLLPGDPGYDGPRTIWNGMIDRRPAMIARCLGASDVMRAVRFAREHGMALCMRSGGHNIAGLAVADGALMIDQTMRRGVFVDLKKRVAHAQGGCTLGDVDRETQIHGLAATLGFVSRTGCAGLTLGGGFGYLTRRFGWTSDTVLSMEVATADGRLVRASESENPDLFWGLRGGGGNFGVVTNIEYRLEDVGPTIIGGGVAWKADDAAGVLDLFHKVTQDSPREMSVVLVMRPAPPAPWLPAEVHGKLIVLLLVCDTGPIAEAEKRAARIKSFGSPVGDILQRRPYITQQALLDATQPDGRRYYWKSEYLPGTSPELLDGMLAHARKIVSPHSAVIAFPLHGKAQELPADHSAVGNRDARMVLNITGAWDKAEDDAKNIAWARATWEDLRRFSTGGTYLNFLNEEDGADRLQDAWGDNYDRLVAVKTAWDPQNLFRMNKNIRPRGG